MYLNDGIQQSVSIYVLDDQVMGIEGNHAQEICHVEKMDAKNCIMCFYTEMKIGR